jgi:hypothetical protein
MAKVSAAMVSAGNMGVAAAPTAAAATEAMSTSVSAAMSTSMAAAMSTSMPTTPMAAATSAGGCKRWSKGDGSPEGCGSGNGDQSLSRHGGVILSGYPSTMRDVRSAI